MELLSLQETFSQIYTQFSETLMNWGYFGMFFGTLISASFIPFPSSVIFLFCIGEAQLNPFITILCATLGNTCGSLILFNVGRLGKLRWLCTYGRIKPQKVRRFVKKARTWGPPVAFLSFLPAFGQTVMVALGLLHCDIVKSTVFAMLGKFLRYVVLALLTLGVINCFN